MNFYMTENIFFETEKNARLDLFLREVLPQSEAADFSEEEKNNLSNSKIRRLIIAGSVSVNGKKVTRPSYELRGKSRVCVALEKSKLFFEKQPEDADFVLSEKDILFEDENFIFINKPAFFPVEQTVTGNRKNLHDRTVEYLWSRNKNLRNPPYAGIMHRLDRTTSGVILFTKNRTVNKEVHDIFESHNLEKKYCAICCRSDFEKSGCEENFSVEMFMGRISKSSQVAKWGKVSQKNGGLYSRTDFSVIGECSVEGKKCVIIECSLFTGRTHQIRVHLSSVGMPVLGDVLYGGANAQRIYLHAKKICFECGGKIYSVEAPISWE